ncbi:AraC family transcriptional regulator [Neobacillus drentensis]|uniref:helix-turn-helix domain-containing protein n=1 Tax=Neobacillus drentensis TaxID=220684 RepID=UPI001F22C54E|nr:AraC family transcriptional regulator [Neobacillus drentensis]ULT54855.1 AraC family transcriptional regulator [Neobacillus drentensis]
MNKELSVQTEYETDFSQKSTELKDLLDSAILTGNMDLVHQVAAIAEQNKDLKIIFDEELDIQKLYIASTITSFVETAIKHGLPKDVAETTKKKYYIMIAQCSSTSELVGYYFQSVEELITEMQQYSMKQFSPIVKMAIEYIHNNKFQFLYAKDVANAIHVNRSYLSDKFSEETGQTLTDYIHNVKLDYAIKLMRSNFYKFNEIAELLGYKNYAYFSKVFKKIYHTTPNHYFTQKDS